MSGSFRQLASQLTIEEERCLWDQTKTTALNAAPSRFFVVALVLLARFLGPREDLAENEKTSPGGEDENLHGEKEGGKKKREEINGIQENPHVRSGVPFPFSSEKTG